MVTMTGPAPVIFFMSAGNFCPIGRVRVKVFAKLYFRRKAKMRTFCGLTVILSFFLSLACGGGVGTNQANTTNNNSATPQKQELKVVDRPQKVKDLMASRGEQDQASPTLKIVEPKAGATVGSSTVKVKLDLGGDLKGYMPGMNEETHTGNHIHVILDNQPYEAYYNLGQDFELRNVTDGDHTLRVFPSRPWHESFKNEGAFAMVSFKVKNGGGDASKPTTSANGNTMANAATPEGKEMKDSKGGDVDYKKPLLTYSRPKGEYKGDDASNVMIDFWLSGAKLTGDGGDYRVRYTIDKEKPGFIDKWAPIWLAGWAEGKHTITLELVGKDDNSVDNGGYNTTVREITITK